MIAPQALRRTEEANHRLVQAARPVLDKLGAAIASTRYFAILTNAQGVVVDVNGPIDRRDRRADLITRIGVDLSEQSVGTTAIGAALTELQPVWLHRSEHFFNDTSAYSCAGAPLFGPDGQCAGMLDLTGVDAVERPELKHLVLQSARSIENALTQSKPHDLLIRLNWSSHSLGEDADGLICLDPDGWVTGANPAARQMVAQLLSGSLAPCTVATCSRCPTRCCLMPQSVTRGAIRRLSKCPCGPASGCTRCRCGKAAAPSDLLKNRRRRHNCRSRTLRRP